MQPRRPSALSCPRRRSTSLGQPMICGGGCKRGAFRRTYLAASWTSGGRIRRVAAEEGEVAMPPRAWAEPSGIWGVWPRGLLPWCPCRTGWWEISTRCPGRRPPSQLCPALRLLGTPSLPTRLLGDSPSAIATHDSLTKNFGVAPPGAP